MSNYKDHPYNNCAIKVLNLEHGKKVLEWWESQGVDTGRSEGDSEVYPFYGLFDGEFDHEDKNHCIKNGIKIIPLPEESVLFKVGDVVRFKGDDGRIPYKFTANIPNHLLKHGSLFLKENKGVVKLVHKPDCIVVSYIDIEGDEVCLGFNPNDLELVKEEVPPMPPIPLWKKYDNCVIEVLDLEHGRKVIKWWKSLGVDTSDFVGTRCKSGGFDNRYYGLCKGRFNYYSTSFCTDNGLEIISLPTETKNEAIINSQIKQKQNGTESGKTIEVQRVDLQIGKGSIGRRAGLKGSGVEISIGDRHRNYQKRSILG